MIPLSFISWGHDLFIGLWLFETITFYSKYLNIKNYPFSIRCWDSNSQPLELVSLPFSTRPRLPANPTISPLLNYCNVPFQV